MRTKVFDNIFIPAGVLPKDIFNYNDDLLNHVLSSNFLPDELVKGHDTPFRRGFQLYSYPTDSWNSFPCKNNIHLLCVVFELVEKLVDVFQVCKSDHKFKFSHFHIQGILKVAKEHSYFFFKNVWVLHQDQVNVSGGDVLDFWLVVHQRD